MTTTALPAPTFAPARGWREADRPRRTAAALALPLTVLTPFAARWEPSAVAAIVVWTLVGPAAWYSLARVLRPGPGTVRHLLAAAGAAYGVVSALATALMDDDLPAQSENLGFVVLTLGPPGVLLPLVTALWGLAALAGRRR